MQDRVNKMRKFLDITDGDKFKSLPALAMEPLSATETKTLIIEIKSIQTH